jgi:hypothetical protein
LLTFFAFHLAMPQSDPARAPDAAPTGQTAELVKEHPLFTPPSF